MRQPDRLTTTAITRARIPWVAAATCGLLALSVTAFAPHSSARDLDTTDVTAATTSNSWTSPKWKYSPVGVVRSANYEQSPKGRYAYYPDFGDLWELDKQCALTRNGKVLLAGTCNDVYGNFELGGAGKYALTVGGKTMVSWNFTPLKDAPKPLKAAVCVLKSVTPGKVTDGGGQIFVLKTNGKCTNGLWNWQVASASGVEGTFARFDYPAKGRLLVLAATEIAAPSTLSFVFVPDGNVVSSAVTLAPVGGSNWKTVPSVAGY